MHALKMVAYGIIYLAGAPILEDSGASMFIWW